MTNPYGMVRENSRRAPSRCDLTAPLREAWNAPASLGGRRHFAPTLAHDGTLLLIDKDAHAVALEAVSRKRIWAYPWTGRPQVLHQGRVFLWPPEHEVHVVDLRSGRPESVMFCNSCEDALAVGNYLVGWGSDYEYGGQRLWAIDWTSGQRLWTKHLPENVSIAGCPCANEDLLVYCQLDQRKDRTASEATLIACRLATGVEVWRRPESGLNGIAAIWNDRVLACLGMRVTALSLQDGSVLWERDGEEGYLYGERYYCLYYCSETRLRKYAVLDALTGKQLFAWDLRARLPKSLQQGEPKGIRLVTETHVFIKSERNVLLAFTRDGGEYVWNHQPKGAYMEGEVVCFGGRLYYQNGSGRQLFCLEPKDR
jgi:outer membrane protein assembly factor BamB